MYYHEPPQQKPRDLRALAFKAGLALLVVLFLVAGVRWAYFNLASQAFRQEVEQFLATLPGQLRAQLSALRQGGGALVEQAANSPLLDLNREQREKQEAEARARRARELAAAREAAWEAYYQPRPECANPGSDEQFVECGNAYRRARVAFEAKWRAEHGTAGGD